MDMSWTQSLSWSWSITSARRAPQGGNENHNDEVTPLINANVADADLTGVDLTDADLRASKLA
jgi:uncharacterized protein YjbI with pentapeptide repeats